MAYVTLLASGQEPRTYELNKPKIIVGRDKSADIHIDNLAISKHHCEFAQENGAFVVRDLQSSNKTFIGGKEISEHRLNDGEEVVIGAYRLKFVNPMAHAAAPVADIPTSDDGFEPTLQLPPEMIRKKLEEMQREKGGGTASAAAKPVAASTSAASSDAPADPKANLVATIFVAAIILVIAINILIFVFLK